MGFVDSMLKASIKDALFSSFECASRGIEVPEASFKHLEYVENEMLRLTEYMANHACCGDEMVEAALKLLGETRIRIARAKISNNQLDLAKSIREKSNHSEH